MASSSPSSTERSYMYDVFLSFRGSDTRHGFTGHLYMALIRAGIQVFRDSEELRTGEVISEALIRAIQGSMYSFVILSENYASSSWCLDELVHIMECKEKLDHKVIPIFYKNDPSDVRHQKGSFGKAFEKHEALKRRTQDEITGWRSALREAASISGWNTKNFRTEGDCIKEVVDDISRRLNNTYLHVAVYPVGIESRIKGICNSLCDGKEDDVRMVGIWGMGGSGKSSLARAVYNKFYHSFENKSFLGNVRETAESNGMITLQERLLSDILKPTKIEVGDVNRGIVVIKKRLESKKALVIVDDVDEKDQLTALALLSDSFGWRKTFGPGSRIIVTTRNRDLLELLEVDKNKIHESQDMKEEEALELFSWHAFHNPCPDDDSGFLELTRRVVTYCKGLPLALEVLGSFLFKKSKRHWKDTLKNLEKFPDGRINKILKISYDALEKDVKEIFLHICCFFVGMNKKYVTQILYGCDHGSEIGISVLLQRCLVTVNERNKLMVHDLVRDMGREVVRVESPKEPEERTRLWQQKEVMDVLTEESGTKKIEGLALNLQRSDKKRFRTSAFREMKRLRLLQLNYVQLDGNYDNVSKQLRWLCWRGFSLEIIQNDFFDEQNLVSIDLRYSNLVQVWEQSRLLEKLKILNLSHSHNLKQTPNFSNLPKLKYLILKDCKSLSEIHESIGSLGRLVLVNLKDCIRLKNLPESFYNLKSVKALVISGCSEFQELSDDIGNMTSLTTLVSHRTAISKVPHSLVNLELDSSSLQDLTRVKHRYPEALRYHLPALTQGFTSLDMGNISVHSPSEGQSLNNCILASGDLPTRSKDLESDHCAALARIPSSPKVSRKNILQGSTANGEGGVFPNYYISPIDLSNLKRMCYNYCASLPQNRDLDTSLKELEADHYANALEVVRNFSETSRQSILQGWTAIGDGGIFLPDIPKWFAYVRKSEQVFFQVPQIIGCNLEAFTVCVICSSLFNENICPSGISIFVTNYTKLINFAVRPAHLSEITSDEVVWQVNLSNNEFNLEGGDFVEVEAIIGSGFTVKNTGVGLVWDPEHSNENKMECEPIRYECESSLGPASSFHHDLSDFHHNECESTLGPYSSDEDRFSERSRQEQQPSSLQIHQLKSGSSSQAKPKLKRRRPCSCWW